MPRARRKENQGLPARWTHRHGAYYYQVPPALRVLWDGKALYRLGKTLPEAYKVWAEKLGSSDKANTIGQLLDRYAFEVVPNKAVTTQAHNRIAIRKLRSVFGDMPLGALQPKHVYGYVSRREAKVAAHREVEVLSHAFTKAVEWGYMNRHPFKKEVRLEGEKPRTRYVTDEEVVEILSLSAMRKRGSIRAIQAYIRIKLLTGLRRGDLLRLRVSDIRTDGVHVRTNKTGKPVIYTITDHLEQALQQAKEARPINIAPWVFCNNQGECYIDEEKGTAAGWKSMWQRFMVRVLKETKVTEPFTEHDLRAKCASDAESLEHARALLTHADSRLTERVYRRKPERVRPLR